MKRLNSGILIVVACATFSVPAKADWPSDASVDVPVANVGANFRPSAIGDDNLGVFVTFENSDATSHSLTVRAEHFDATGNRLWDMGVDGGYVGKDLLGLSIGTGYTGKVLGMTDGDAGGFIVSYAPGNYPYKLDVQHFDKNGTAQWCVSGSYGGVELLATPYENDAFYMIPDQQDGLLITWLDNGAHAQRFNASGTQYGTGFTWPNVQYPSPFYSDRYMCADGQGGLYYIGSTSGSVSQSAELSHLNPSGASTFDVAAATGPGASFAEWATVGIADGGGAWVSWYESGTLYLQFYDSDGGAVLDAGGAAGIHVAQVATGETDPTMLNDGTGGTVVAWFDIVSSVNVLLAQRFAADGSPLWGANPVVVTGTEGVPQAPNGYQPSYRFIPTTDNNVAAFWAVTPNGIYGQKVAMDGGGKLWGPFSSGTSISLIYNPQWIDATFIEDDSAFVTFQDGQNVVWIKHINADGTLGTVDAGINYGADAGPDAGADAGEDAGVDAGTGIDAGVDAGVDAGSDGGNQINWPDAGQDAGTGTDAGLPDSGQMADAGTGGGGCSQGSGRPDPVWLIAGLAILAFAGRRRLRQI
jgi:hypothetical protein